MSRKFFNSVERFKRESEANKKRAVVRRKIAKAENDRLLKNWLQSAEGEAYKRDLLEREIISARAALDYEVMHSKYVEFANWLAERGDI